MCEILIFWESTKNNFFRYLSTFDCHYNLNKFEQFEWEVNYRPLD